MSERKTLTCIICPRGCVLTVAIDGGMATVSGQACPKGETYGRQEAVEPLRSLTTTVRTDSPSRPRLPVRGDGDIPLRRLREALSTLDEVVARAPIKHGDVLVKDILGLGVNLIATDDLQASEAHVEG